LKYPGATSQEVLDFLLWREIFRKKLVAKRNSPAFIGNRVGIYGIQVCSIWLKKWACD
jgi:3-hydroxyacyl-CoA dehydrogenase